MQSYTFLRVVHIVVAAVVGALVGFLLYLGIVHGSVFALVYGTALFALSNAVFLYYEALEYLKKHDTFILDVFVTWLPPQLLALGLTLLALYALSL